MKKLSKNAEDLICRHRNILRAIRLQESLMTEREVKATYDNLRTGKAYPKYFDDESLIRVLDLKRLLIVRKNIEDAAKKEPQTKGGIFNAFTKWIVKPTKKDHIEAVKDIQEKGEWICPDGYAVQLDENGIVRRAEY